MRHFLGLSTLALLAIAGCSKSESPSACEGDGVSVSDAWVRAGHAGQKMGAAYISLCNGGSGADRLTGVSYADAKAAELHQTTVSEDGVAGMSAMANGLELPPGEAVSMAPGGAHIMLIGLEAPLTEGGEAELTLHFENAPSQTVTLPIRAASDAGHSGH